MLDAGPYRYMLCLVYISASVVQWLLACQIRLFSYTLKHYVVYFYEYLCKLKDMRKVFEKNFLSDSTIVQETNGVIVFNM